MKNGKNNNPKTKERWIRLGMFLASTFLALILLEGLSRVYVYKIKHKGKIFQRDNLLGWKVKPNLHESWENKGGGFWSIQTDDLKDSLIPDRKDF